MEREGIAHSKEAAVAASEDSGGKDNHRGQSQRARGGLSIPVWHRGMCFLVISILDTVVSIFAFYFQHLFRNIIVGI